MDAEFSRIQQEALLEIVELIKNRKKVLVFCSGVQHSKNVSAALNELGVPSASVTGDTQSLFRDQIVKDFKASKLKALCNAEIFTTGFDAPDIDCLVLLRATKSLTLFHQMCLDTETEILTEKGWQGYEDLDNINQVYGFDMETGEISLQKVTQKTVKKEAETITYQSPNVDFRVTTDHDLVLRARNGNKWKKEQASKAYSRKSGFHIPICGAFANTSNVDLTLKEMKFLGLVYSDGYLDKNKVLRISQAQGEASSLVREVIQNCNLQFSEYIQKRTGEWKKYKDIISFYITLISLKY